MDKEYTKEVKKALCKILDYCYESKHRILVLDTDQDCPYICLGLKSVSGFHKEDKNWISPEKDESWCFLECCNRLIKELKID